MKIKELFQQAEQAETFGIPVDWKTLAYRTLEASQAQVDAHAGNAAKTAEQLQEVRTRIFELGDIAPLENWDSDLYAALVGIRTLLEGSDNSEG